MTTTERVIRVDFGSHLERRERAATNGITISLSELDALAELLQKNSGGLSEESAQSLGDSIACVSNTIAAAAYPPLTNELDKLDALIIPLQENAGGLSEAAARAVGRSISRTAKALRTSGIARRADA